MTLTPQDTRELARSLKDHGVDYQVALDRLYGNYTDAGHTWTREHARAVFGVYFPLRASGLDAAAEYDAQRNPDFHKSQEAKQREMEALEDQCVRTPAA